MTNKQQLTESNFNEFNVHNQRVQSPIQQTTMCSSYVRRTERMYDAQIGISNHVHVWNQVPLAVTYVGIRYKIRHYLW